MWKCIKFVLESSILLFDIFNFSFSLLAFLCLGQFFLLLCLKVLINCTLLKELLHICSLFQFLSNINLRCLLSQCTLLIVWWVRIRRIFIKGFARKWFLNFLHSKLSKLKTFLSFIELLSGKLSLLVIWSISHQLLSLKGLYFCFLFLLYRVFHLCISLRIILVNNTFGTINEWFHCYFLICVKVNGLTLRNGVFAKNL